MRLLFISCCIAAATAVTAFRSDEKLLVTSPTFGYDQLIPAKYTCQGDEVNPELNIAGIPSGAKSLAVIMDDPDAPQAGGYTHWVAWNIPVSGTIPENFKKANQGLNGSKKKGYTPPCPPNGTHHYHFKVYALDSELSLPATTDKEGLEKAMTGHILSQGELLGAYSRD